MPFENFSIRQISKNGKSVAAAISPDGKYVLSVVMDKGQSSLWLRHLPTDSDTQIVPPSDAIYFGPIFAPDGNFIYFLKRESAAADEADLYRAPILGGTPQLTVHEADNPITFSPDGKRIAYVRTGHPDPEKFSLLTANADGSDEKILVNGPMTEQPFYPAWTPDGKAIAGVVYENSGELSQIKMFDAATGKETKLAGFKDYAPSFLTWLPSGDGMLLTAEARGSGFIRQQIGYFSSDEPGIRFVTQDTNNYITLRLSADGKTLSAIQRHMTFGFFNFPAAAAMAGRPPDVTGIRAGARYLRVQLGAGKYAVRERRRKIAARECGRVGRGDGAGERGGYGSGAACVVREREIYRVHLGRISRQHHCQHLAREF